MVLFCSSCRDLFPVQVRQGNFREVLDVMRLDGKKVLILLASKDCSVCEATKDDWAGDKMLVEKLNRNFRVWQLEITDEKNALIPQVLRSLSTPTLSRRIIVCVTIVGTGTECASSFEYTSLHVVFFGFLFFF